MGITAFIKRFVPFFLTFAVGLFIASFFVSISAPSLELDNSRWSRHREYHRRMEAEKRRLREENCQMKRRIAELEKQSWAINPDLAVPPPPLPPSSLTPPAKMRPVKVE